ncbi:MAG: hypothetical protein LCH88_09185 [Proteobacteria bacterium]|nr:hypothetical protein [Pseudomonadota bacterium]
MTIVQLYPPIAAATFVVAIWFGVAYHFHRKERDEGGSTLQAFWYALPGIAFLTFAYFHGFKTPVTGPFPVFMSAVLGLIMGGLFAFVLREVYLGNAEDRSQRRQQIGALVFFAGLMAMSFLLV